MTYKQFFIMLGAIIGIVILTNLPFLPGPKFLYFTAHLFFNVGQLFGMIGLILVPFGLIWTIRKFRKPERKNLLTSNLLWAIPLTIFLSTTYLSDRARNFSRSFAIKRAEELIKSIEVFKQQNGFYPNTLTNTGIKIPSTGIIGIHEFYYNKMANSYELTFHQNVFMNFNYEIVTYNNTNNHTAKGEMKKLHGTGFDHWKYEIFD